MYGLTMDLSYSLFVFTYNELNYTDCKLQSINAIFRLLNRHVFNYISSPYNRMINYFYNCS